MTKTNQGHTVVKVGETPRSGGGSNVKYQMDGNCVTIAFDKAGRPATPSDRKAHKAVLAAYNL